MDSLLDTGLNILHALLQVIFMMTRALNNAFEVRKLRLR